MTWTLHEGDCLDILPTLQAGSVDAVVTDPPFFTPVQHYNNQKDWGRKWADLSVLGGWWRQVTVELRRVCKPDAHLIVFCDRVSYAVFLPPIYERWPNINSVVWDKGSIKMGKPWRHQHELMIAACSSGSYISTTSQSDVLRVPVTAGADREHPVEKPRELLASLVEATTPKGGLVLDAFAGSGTTLEAAEQIERNSIGIEASPDYCELIRRRMATIQPTLL